MLHDTTICIPVFSRVLIPTRPALSNDSISCRLALRARTCFAMRMTAMRLIVLMVLGMAACFLGGCSDSGPAKRNIDAVYRFENLRTPTPGAGDKSILGGPDEWSPVKSILDRASAKPVVVNRFAVRTLGNVEIANYEARCVLPTLAEFSRVQTDIESLGAADRPGRDRIETYLSGISATYKSNFVLATVNVGVSGAGVNGHRVRIYGAPGDAPVETTVGSSGIWTARLSVVPETKWVYGLSEDPAGKVPTRYFRVNVTTRAQERVEEAAFKKLFPPGAAAPAMKAVPESDRPGAPSASRDDRAFQDQRKREDEEIRKRREEEDKRLHGKSDGK